MRRRRRKRREDDEEYIRERAKRGRKVENPRGEWCVVGVATGLTACGSQWRGLYRLSLD